MSSVSRSLHVRLTCSYGLALLFMVVAFTSVATLFSAQLANVMNARMQLVDEHIPEAVARLRKPGQSLYAVANKLGAALVVPGVEVSVFDSKRGLGLIHGHTVRLSEEREGGLFFHPPRAGPNDRLPHGGMMFTTLLGLHHLEHPVEDGAIVLVPQVTELGAAYSLYIVEIIVLALVTCLVAGIIGFHVTLGAIAPLKQVTEALGYLAHGDFRSHKVNFSDRTEIGELATAYNLAATSVTTAIADRDRAEKQMRQFIADASHELRTPLTVILCYLEVLKKTVPEEEALRNQIYQTMVNEGFRMRSLVNNLLMLMRLEQDSGRPFKPIDLTELVETAVKPLRALDHSDRLQLELHTEARIMGDTDELREAVTNIIDNALKYTQAGAIKIVVDSNRDWAWVAICDQGDGIPYDEQAAVFERFYRGTQRADIEGSGLGLAIAQRAVQRAGGTIRMTSVPGEGTQFELKFPHLIAERIENDQNGLVT